VVRTSTRAPERRVGADQPGGVEPVEHGHADVHEDHVREGAAGHVDSLASVRGGAGDLHVLLGVDERGEAVADRRLVVGDEDADHRPGS
jgi:hypothetical protein